MTGMLTHAQLVRARSHPSHCAQDENTCQFDRTSQWVTHTRERHRGMERSWGMLPDAWEY